MADDSYEVWIPVERVRKINEEALVLVELNKKVERSRGNLLAAIGFASGSCVTACMALFIATMNVGYLLGAVICGLILWLGIRKL